ncbi:MAG TPA: hypothetical protein VIN67_05650 [Desulfobaccales bacterium]
MHLKVATMHDDHSHTMAKTDLQKILPECPEPGKVFASPLGWSIKGRLLCAALASALLWLSVAWAIGWLS